MINNTKYVGTTDSKKLAGAWIEFITQITNRNTTQNEASKKLR